MVLSSSSMSCYSPPKAPCCGPGSAGDTGSGLTGQELVGLILADPAAISALKGATGTTGGSGSAGEITTKLTSDPAALAALWKELEKLDKELTPLEMAQAIALDPAALAALKDALGIKSGALDPSSLAPGPLPSGVTIGVSQITGPGALASGITIDASQITGTIPASSLPPNVLTTKLGPVSGSGATSKRDLILTLNGVETAYPLQVLTSGVGGKNVVGFIFPAN